MFARRYELRTAIQELNALEEFRKGNKDWMFNAEMIESIGRMQDKMAELIEAFEEIMSELRSAREDSEIELETVYNLVAYYKKEHREWRETLVQAVENWQRRKDAAESARVREMWSDLGDRVAHEVQPGNVAWRALRLIF